MSYRCHCVVFNVACVYRKVSMGCEVAYHGPPLYYLIVSLTSTLR